MLKHSTVEKWMETVLVVIKQGGVAANSFDILDGWLWLKREGGFVFVFVKF